MRIPTLIAIVLVLPLGLFAKDSDEALFWRWFAKNQDRLFHFDADKEKILDEISSQLRGYKKGLMFEISSEQNGLREFIISADGLKELFTSVTKLVAAAPPLKKWKIVAFRPRMENYSNFSVDYAGRQFDPKKLWFYHRIQEKSFDVIFYHPNLKPEERNQVSSGTYILLDMALGEHDAVTGIRYIDHQSLPKNPKADGLRPFSELRTVFDEFKSKTGRTKTSNQTQKAVR